MYGNKSIVPITEPCGTPNVTYVMSDRAPLTETRCLRFGRKYRYVIQLCVLPVIPNEVSLDRRRLCVLLHNAFSSHGLSLLVIVSPSSVGLRALISVCEKYGISHDIRFNHKQSAIMICRSKYM